LETKVTPFYQKITLNIRGKLYALNHPLVMGILNVTPDSFYDGSKYLNQPEITSRLKQMVLEGVDIIDIGGYSSRPGAAHISIKSELERILPAISTAREVAPEIPISIDTFRSDVASAALDAGADMINDISGGGLDPLMFELVADRQVPYILMHMKGDPQTMEQQIVYDDLLTDILQYFLEKITLLHQLGVKDVIIDPGFGFAKSKEQNFRLLANLNYLKTLGLPLLAGLSRKSMIYKTLEVTPEKALTGTIAANTIALIQGANILRVHDIAEAKQTINLFKQTFP
jgi:dihydropteroate synthase